MNKSEPLTDLDVTIEIHHAIRELMSPDCANIQLLSEVEAFATGYILASVRAEEEPEEYRNRLFQMIILVYGIDLSTPAKRTLQ